MRDLGRIRSSASAAQESLLSHRNQNVTATVNNNRNGISSSRHSQVQVLAKTDFARTTTAATVSQINSYERKIQMRSQQSDFNHGEDYRTSNGLKFNSTTIAMEKPYFLQKLEDKTVVEGQFVELMARVQGATSVSWIHNGKILPNCPDFQQTFTNFESSLSGLVNSARAKGYTECRLKIADVFLEDSGRYICKANNNAGTGSTSVCSARVTVSERKLRKTNMSATEENLTNASAASPDSLNGDLEMDSNFNACENKNGTPEMSPAGEHKSTHKNEPSINGEDTHVGPSTVEIKSNSIQGETDEKVNTDSNRKVGKTNSVKIPIAQNGDAAEVSRKLFLDSVKLQQQKVQAIIEKLENNLSGHTEVGHTKVGSPDKSAIVDQVDMSGQAGDSIMICGNESKIEIPTVDEEIQSDSIISPQLASNLSPSDPGGLQNNLVVVPSDLSKTQNDADIWISDPSVSKVDGEKLVIGPSASAGDERIEKVCSAMCEMETSRTLENSDQEQDTSNTSTIKESPSQENHVEVLLPGTESLSDLSNTNLVQANDSESQIETHDFQMENLCLDPSVIDGSQSSNLLQSNCEVSSVHPVEEFAECPHSVKAEEVVTMTDISSPNAAGVEENLKSGESESEFEGRAPQVMGPSYILALKGETVHLRIKVSGHPHPIITWSKAGKQLEPDARLQVEGKDEFSSVNIEAVNYDDSGRYVAKVENEFGMVLHAANLSVEGPPEPPSRSPTAIFNENQNGILVSWAGAPYDGGSALTSYHLQVSQDEEEWSLECQSAWLTATISTPEPGSSYRFRVLAENSYGLGSPSHVSIPVVVPRINPIVDNTTNKSEDDGTDESKYTPIRLGSYLEFYEKGEELGKGRFGTVFKVTHKTSRKELASKIVRCIKAADKDRVRQEVEIMNLLRHPKLIELVDAFETSREIVIITEKINGGELFERVVADDFTLTEFDCVGFMRQIMDGVRFIHSKSIIHLDLKPENILCLTRSTYNIKIIDFGLSQKYDSSTSLRVLFGTPEFVAPEIINYEPISPASDMWALGVITYVLLSGLSPFMGDSDSETFANITAADFDFEDDAFATISNEAKEFISSLLVKRQEKRLNADECLAHKWLAYPEPAKNIVIPTDKLKRFIIRRKWQKTGNAIRALGRITMLYSSRRSSDQAAAVANASSVDSGISLSPTSTTTCCKIFEPNPSTQVTQECQEEQNDGKRQLQRQARVDSSS